MKYTDEEIQKFKKKFKRRKSLRKIIFFSTLIFLIIVGLIVLPLMDTLGIQRRVWTPVIYIIMFGVIFAIVIIWRCPVCNGIMGDVFNTKFCSKCGFKFED